MLSYQEYSYFHAYGGLGVSKICVESKFVAYSRAERSGVVRVPLQFHCNFAGVARKAGGPNCRNIKLLADSLV